MIINLEYKMNSYKTLQLFFLALLPTLSVGYEIKGI